MSTTRKRVHLDRFPGMELFKLEDVLCALAPRVVLFLFERKVPSRFDSSALLEGIAFDDLLHQHRDLVVAFWQGLDNLLDRGSIVIFQSAAEGVN